MTIRAEVLDALLAAGATAEMIVAAVKADAARDEARHERRREQDAERQRRHRARNAPSRVTGCDNADDRDVAPSPDKSPPDPQKLTPTPCAWDAHARGLAARLALATLIAGCEALRTRPVAKPKPRWPKAYPPPPGVSDEQWAGLVEHRVRRRATFTPRAYELLCKRLADFADDDWPPGRLVDLIVERNWLTFDPSWLPRKTEHRNGNRPHDDRRSGWAARPGMEGVEPASLDDDDLG